MPQKKPLSLSDLIRNPDAIAEDPDAIRSGDDIEYVKEYGIDCHSKFIEICIRCHSGSGIRKAQAHFSTSWNDLVAARDWCLDVLWTKADPAPDLSGPLHCLVESTANYHTPVCMAWGGNPTIINPAIAGATKRKTNVPDSRLPALHDQLNIWRECCIPDEDVKALRVMISQRDRCIHDATAAGSRINNIITRFGLTAGRNGSIVRDSMIRTIVENQISNHPSMVKGLCPLPIPMEVRQILRAEYKKSDQLTLQAEEYRSLIFEKARSMEWETGSGTLPGSGMIHIPATAGWRAYRHHLACKSVTPRRFHSAKALSSCCGPDPNLKISAGKVTGTVMRGGNNPLHKALTITSPVNGHTTHCLSLSGTVIDRTRRMIPHDNRDRHLHSPE